MLRDVIAFVKSRTGYTDRDIILREINFAWTELWITDDLVGALYEMTVQPFDQMARVTLPHYVGTIRAVKQFRGRQRVSLYDPRPYYHDSSYAQAPYTWRVLGRTPLKTSIINASTLTLSLTSPEDIQITTTLKGPTDNAAGDTEQITFAPGELTKETAKRFSDLTSWVKSDLTKSNLVLTGANNEDFGYIANNEYEARNTVVQIMDKCDCVCTNCRCFDVLYKNPAPVLVDDETFVPFQEVLMTKTLEWITLPKKGEEDKAAMYASKAATLLGNFNNNDQSVEKKIDLPRNPFATIYYGYL